MMVLASKSPRRKEILDKLPVDYRVISSDMDEKKITADNPVKLSKKLAEAKGLKVSNNSKEYVLAADTVVSFNGVTLGKPTNSEHCRDMLMKLSANKHQVITGVSLCLNGDVVYTFHVITWVYFRPLSNSLINWYISTKEPFDKAGGYGIQGKGGVFVEKLEGCFYNVMGLPLSRTAELLGHHGLIDWGK
ncbi:Maf family protein [Proteinivorax tanatarense]|uniref:dTTP/UTP pyrophosphatase n=1 Tax=Proteinivorax tanatarense TaxID=1260629 RepID=A0AAU7VIW3_9FIRM